MNDKAKPKDKTLSEAELTRKKDIVTGDSDLRRGGFGISDTTAPPPNPHRGDKDKGNK